MTSAGAAGSVAAVVPPDANWPKGSALRMNVRRCAGSDFQYASSSRRPCGSASMRLYRSLAVARRSACTCAVAASDGAMSSSKPSMALGPLRFFFFAAVRAAGVSALALFMSESSSNSAGALAMSPDATLCCTISCIHPRTSRSSSYVVLYFRASSRACGSCSRRRPKY